jgi:2'-5' RNA ligase
LRDDRRPRRPGPGEAALFVAVPVPADVSGRVAALVDEIRLAVEVPNGGRGGHVRWVRFSGLHVTIRFLGATPTDQIPALAGAIERAAATVAPFPVGIRGAGAFPNDARPRALWLGLEPGAEPLAAIAAALDGELEVEGWARDPRPFRPHLTIGRTDGAHVGPAAARALEEAAADLELGFTADRLVLFESRPARDRGPAEYHPLHAAELGGQAALARSVAPDGATG